MNLFEQKKKKDNKGSSAYSFIQNILNSKKFKNSILIIFLIVFIGGYAIFFTSPLYMPLDKSNYRITALNSPNTLDEQHIFTIVRWQYSEEQKRMEVELDIENTAYDGMIDYNIQVRTDPSSRPTVTKIINDTSWLILQIDNISDDFQIISLQISLQNDINTILKLYTNPEAVERVDKLEVLSRTEYQINRLERNITLYQQEIEEFNNQIADRKNKIANIEAQNKELAESRPFRTESEIQQIDNQIKQNESLIENEDKAIEEINAEILENKNRIQLTQKQIEEIK